MKATFNAERSDDDKSVEISLSTEGYDNENYCGLIISNEAEYDILIDDLHSALSAILTKRELEREREKHLKETE